MNYNTKCPCCNWKFYVEESIKGNIVCVKCGSMWTDKNLYIP